MSLVDLFQLQMSEHITYMDDLFSLSLEDLYQEDSNCNENAILIIDLLVHKNSMHS